MSREDDINKIVKVVLGIEPVFWDDPNGGYNYDCPFCNGGAVVGGRVAVPTTETIKHDLWCPYLVAKDLNT